MPVLRIVDSYLAHVHKELWFVFQATVCDFETRDSFQNFRGATPFFYMGATPSPPPPPLPGFADRQTDIFYLESSTINGLIQ